MARGVAPLLLLGCLFVLGCASTPNATPPSDPQQTLDPSDPFDSLAHLAREITAAAEIARGADASAVPFGRGEGALHVLRLMRRAIDEEIAWADTAHPFFQAQDERYAKLALGNPDNLYLVARAEEDAIYRITGRRGTTADFTIQLYQGYPGIHRPMTARGALGLDRLITNDEGLFEVTIGGPPQSENWIELAPDTRRILVRYTYGDWANEEAGELRIERVDAGQRPDHPVDDAVVARRIRAAADYLGDALTGYLEIVDQVYAGLEVNTLRPMRRLSGAVGGLMNQYNASGRYQLEADQALVVTTHPSDARYQGFQIGTEWFEALDFVNQTTSLNTKQASLSPDGLYRFVISARDPGVANWLDASGAPKGQMLLRWQGSSVLGPEHEPQVELVRLDEVASRFAPEEIGFDDEARRAQIVERQAAIARRFGLSKR